MHKHTLIATLSVALLGGTSAYAQRCANNSWNPELYCFYGEKDKMVEKLGKIPAKLSERRVFLQITQGDGNANVKLYEQQKDGTFTVTQWSAERTSRLLSRIDDEILANKGMNCVGEQVKGVLGEELKEGKVTNAVPAPASPRAAFTHSVEEASGDFIKSTVIILC